MKNFKALGINDDLIKGLEELDIITPSDIQNEVNKATEIDSLNIKDTKENSKEKDD